MYEQYIKHYQYWKGCTIPEFNAIVDFTKYWEQEGIPPHMWREWLKQHRSKFEETGSVHDVLKELKKYAEVSRKAYLEQAEQQVQKQSKLSEIIGKLSKILKQLRRRHGN